MKSSTLYNLYSEYRWDSKASVTFWRMKNLFVNACQATGAALRSCRIAADHVPARQLAPMSESVMLKGSKPRREPFEVCRIARRRPGPEASDGGLGMRRSTSEVPMGPASVLAASSLVPGGAAATFLARRHGRMAEAAHLPINNSKNLSLPAAAAIAGRRSFFFGRKMSAKDGEGPLDQEVKAKVSSDGDEQLIGQQFEVGMSPFETHIRDDVEQGMCSRGGLSGLANPAECEDSMRKFIEHLGLLKRRVDELESSKTQLTKEEQHYLDWANKTLLRGIMHAHFERGLEQVRLAVGPDEAGSGIQEQLMQKLTQVSAKFEERQKMSKSMASSNESRSVQEEETLRAEFQELKRAFEAMEGEIREVKKAKGEDKGARQQQPGGSLVGLSGFIMRWTAWYIGRYGSKPIDLKFVSHMTSRMPEVYVGIRHVTSNTVEVEKIDAISGLVSDDVVQVLKSNIRDMSEADKVRGIQVQNVTARVVGLHFCDSAGVEKDGYMTLPTPREIEELKKKGTYKGEWLQVLVRFNAVERETVSWGGSVIQKGKATDRESTWVFESKIRGVEGEEVDAGDFRLVSVRD